MGSHRPRADASVSAPSRRIRYRVGTAGSGSPVWERVAACTSAFTTRAIHQPASQAGAACLVRVGGEDDVLQRSGARCPVRILARLSATRHAVALEQAPLPGLSACTTELLPFGNLACRYITGRSPRWRRQSVHLLPYQPVVKAIKCADCGGDPGNVNRATSVRPDVAPWLSSHGAEVPSHGARGGALERARAVSSRLFPFHYLS